jgi:NAD(P)H-nitrite reductase large subunit
MDKEFFSQIDLVADLLATESEKLADDFLICECFCVSAGDIREICANLGHFDLQTVQDNFSLGHGCQSCLKDIDSWAQKIF